MKSAMPPEAWEKVHTLLYQHEDAILDIARGLDISQEMVLQIANDLTRKGDLQEIGADCDSPQGGCSDCPAHGSCESPVRQWFLTENGRSVVSSK